MILLDGAMGTLLQKSGASYEHAPETLNITRPELIESFHKAYIDAGADILYTNTFGANSYKLEQSGYSVSEIISAAVANAKRAAEGTDALTALDIGPVGMLIEPVGSMSFDSAYEYFKEQIEAGQDADLIVFETMTDLYELKAAVLAAKENCDLPIFVTNVYDASGKLMTGADAAAMTALLESLRVDALGLNCSLGPDKMLPIAKTLCRYASVPVIVNPNAGLPEMRDGKTIYTVTADVFSDYMAQLADMGASILGGCCGTTPEYIAQTVMKTQDLPYAYPEEKQYTLVSSYTHAVEIGDDPILIGERINPTGKPKLKEALRSGDMNYVLNEAIQQTEKGAHILDVNVGLPEIDETAAMVRSVKEIQAVCDTPLQIDSTKPDTLREAMRCYNGKPLVNSVNGTEESMNAVFPIVQQYGGALIALTIDEKGIPDNAEDRASIAEKIILRAEKYGIHKKDIIVDPLALTR